MVKKQILHETNTKILYGIATKVKSKKEVIMTYRLFDKIDNTVAASEQITDFLYIFKND